MALRSLTQERKGSIVISLSAGGARVVEVSSYSYNSNNSPALPGLHVHCFGDPLDSIEAEILCDEYREIP